MLDSIFSAEKIKIRISKFVEKSLYGKIKANTLTLLALVMGLISSLFIFISGKTIYWELMIVLSSVSMTISFIFDWFDGYLARLDSPTTFGGIMDVFFDRIVETFLILGIVSTDPQKLLWSGMFTLSSIILCITIFLIIGVSVKEENLNETEKLIYYTKGFMERGETFIFLFLSVVLYWIRPIILWIFAVLIYLTAIQRFWIAYKIFYKRSKKN